MIVVLFGQPHSGKSTLAKEVFEMFEWGVVNIDGDQLRDIFANKDYSREGRIKNLNRASDIATFINKTGGNPVLSLVYPYKEARDYLNSLNDDVKWVYLTYEGERGREKNHVSDFDIPEDGVLHLNTSSLNLEECVSEIKNYIHDGKIPSQFSGEDIL
jgi:adenylylsulfate kinase-like enzyme